MTNYTNGHEAEQVAATYLEHCGFKILDQNWRTRWCEIDIVAQKDNVIYFVEVKYRLNARQGNGLDYVTPKKIKQMHFAAENWVNEHNWQSEYQLAAIEMIGADFKVQNFVTEVL